MTKAEKDYWKALEDWKKACLKVIERLEKVYKPN